MVLIFTNNRNELKNINKLNIIDFRHFVLIIYNNLHKQFNNVNKTYPSMHNVPFQSPCS
jgi:hypothetical protein